MKFLRVLIIFTLIVLPVFAEDLESDSDILQGFIEQEVHMIPAVELDKSIDGNKLNFKKIEKINSTLKIKDKTVLEPPKAYGSKFSSVEYNMAPVTSNYAIQSGRWSYGTIFNSSIDTTEWKSSTGLFTRYDAKHFAINAAMSRNDGAFSYSDNIYIAPEWKINRQLSVKEVFKSEFGQTKTKNEIVLMYKPQVRNHPDLLQFEVGAGQSFNQNQSVGQSFRFSTKIRL